MTFHVRTDKMFYAEQPVLLGKKRFLEDEEEEDAWNDNDKKEYTHAPRTDENKDDMFLDPEDIKESMVEWEEAVAVHDQEFFDEYEKTHNDTIASTVPFSGGPGTNETDSNAEQANNEGIFVDKDEMKETITEWEEATAVHDREFFDEYEQTQTQNGSAPTGNTAMEEETIEELEEELAEAEKEAEKQWAAEDAELDREGYTDGTEPVVVNDPDEGMIIPEDGGLIMDDGDDSVTQRDDEPISSMPPNTEVTGKTKTWNAGGQEQNLPNFNDNDMDDTNNAGKIVEPLPNDDDDIVKVPDSGWPVSPTVAETIECSGLIGQFQCTYEEHQWMVFILGAFLPLFMIFCLWKCCCRSKSQDTRGEYRAVAAQYGDMSFDNTFSDALSDEEDDDFINGNGDIEDDSWGKSGKRTLEMSNLGHGRDDGLSLHEMNG